MSAARRIFMAIAGLSLLLATLQFFFAGLGVWDGGDFDLHQTVGRFLQGLLLALLITAAAGRLGRTALIFGAGLLALIFVQSGLAYADGVIGALHPLVGIATWFGTLQAFVWARTGSASLGGAKAA